MERLFTGMDPVPSAPAGPNGPLGREVPLDLGGPALRASVEYCLREGVATPSALQFPHEAADAQGAIGYGGTVLTALAPPTGGRRARWLRLMDLTQAEGSAGGAAVATAPAHLQRLGFGLTDAVPQGAAAAAEPKWHDLLRLGGLPAKAELMRALFVPGDQRPHALVLRSPAPEGAAGRYHVDWVNLRPSWQTLALGATVDISSGRQSARLLTAAHHPYVVNPAAGQDAGFHFVVMEGAAPVQVDAFGQFLAEQMQRLHVFHPPSQDAWGAPPVAVRWPLRQTPAVLSAVAVANTGVVAACIDGQVAVMFPGAAADRAPLLLPMAPALAACHEVAAVHLDLAAGGRFLAATRRGRQSGGESAQPVEHTAACLYALWPPKAGAEAETPAYEALTMVQEAGINTHFAAVCFAQGDLDEVDAARLAGANAQEALAWGGARLVRSVRAWVLADAPAHRVMVGLTLANISQLWRLSFAPDLFDARAHGGYQLQKVAQTYNPAARLDRTLLWEHNASLGARLFASGCPGVVLQYDGYRRLFPRFWAEEDQERGNGRLAGGVMPLRLAETRPEVVAEAARRGKRLRENRVTLGPWMSRDGRFLFAGLDGNRIHRWDFAHQGEANGHLSAHESEPSLVPEHERPRTETLQVTPFSRLSKESFLATSADLIASQPHGSGAGSAATPGGQEGYREIYDRVLRRADDPEPLAVLAQKVRLAGAPSAGPSAPAWQAPRVSAGTSARTGVQSANLEALPYVPTRGASSPLAAGFFSGAGYSSEEEDED